MTTIKDMLLLALRDIGADGVADGLRVHTLDDLELRTPYIGLDGRPAFRGADGRLVPLPLGWALRRYDMVMLNSLTGRGALITKISGGFRCRLARRLDTDAFDISDYPTAPEAWAAAEAWLKEQGR